MTAGWGEPELCMYLDKAFLNASVRFIFKQLSSSIFYFAYLIVFYELENGLLVWLLKCIKTHNEHPYIDLYEWKKK